MVRNIDWHLLEKDIIDHLRGDMATHEASAAMGYEKDQVKGWLESRASFLWVDFVALAELSGHIALPEIFARVFVYRDDLRRADLLLNSISGNRGASHLGRMLGVPKQTASRWLTGHTPVTFLTILQVLETETSFLDFLALIVPERSHNLAAVFAQRQRYREMHRSHPYVGMVIRAIEVFASDGIIHPTVEQIGAIIGINPDKVERTITELLKQGFLTTSAEGAYQVTPVVERFHVGSAKEEMLTYWLERGIDQLRHSYDAQGSRFTYYNMSVGDEGLAELELIFANLQRDLRDLSLKHSKNPKHIRNVTLQLLNPSI